MNSPKNTSSEHVVYKYCFDKQKKNNVCTQYVPNLYFLRNSINNLLSNCGLTDARMRASELPVINVFIIFVSEDTEVFGNY